MEETQEMKNTKKSEPTKLDEESKAIIGGFFQQLAILTNRVNELEKEIVKLKNPKYNPFPVPLLVHSDLNMALCNVTEE